MTEADRRRAFESTALSVLEHMRKALSKVVAASYLVHVDADLERLRNLVVKGEP